MDKVGAIILAGYAGVGLVYGSYGVAAIALLAALIFSYSGDSEIETKK